MSSSSSSSSGDYTCPVDGSLDELQTAPFLGNLTFYRFNLILSGAAMAISCLVSFSSIILHATHLSKPGEQTKIIRIAMFIPFYSIYSYLILAFPNVQNYLLPWRDFVEAIALATFFILLCEFISPSTAERDIFFSGLELPRAKNGDVDPQDPLVWYRRKWISVFQFPLVALFVAVVTDITEAANVYCLTSYSIHFAHLWMVILINISLSICFMAILVFYRALQPQLSSQRPLAKFFAFKGIIAITFVVSILFAILRGANALNPTSALNYADVSVGIPTLIILLALVPFSIFFHYAYSYRPYVIRPGMYAELTSTESKPTSATNRKGTATSNVNANTNGTALVGFTPSYQGGFLGCRAYIHAFDPSEVIRGILFMFTLFGEEAQRRGAAAAAAAAGSGRSTGRRASRRNASPETRPDEGSAGQAHQMHDLGRQQQQQRGTQQGQQMGPGRRDEFAHGNGYGYVEWPAPMLHDTRHNRSGH